MSQYIEVKHTEIFDPHNESLASPCAIEQSLQNARRKFSSQNLSKNMADYPAEYADILISYSKAYTLMHQSNLTMSDTDYKQMMTVFLAYLQHSPPPVCALCLEVPNAATNTVLAGSHCISKQVYKLLSKNWFHLVWFKGGGKVVGLDGFKCVRLQCSTGKKKAINPVTPCEQYQGDSETKVCEAVIEYLKHDHPSSQIADQNKRMEYNEKLVYGIFAICWRCLVADPDCASAYAPEYNNSKNSYPFELERELRNVLLARMEGNDQIKLKGNKLRLLLSFEI
jgi:hypothetical protein